MSDEKAEEVVLTAVKTQGPISPRRLEAMVVESDTPAREARVAVQRLLVKGELKVDDNLELVAEPAN